MPSKIILKVTKGELSGKEFTYSKKEQLFVGRQEDCAIVLPDKSVSRYHCMLEVTPPYVTVRDFGSLNGTFLNGEKVGGRERSVSAEDAQKEYHKEFDLHDGNILGLGKQCELILRTIVAKCCADCGEEVLGTDEVGNGETTPDDTPQKHVNDRNEPICKACYSRREAKKRDDAPAAIEKECIEKEKTEAVAEALAKKLKAAEQADKRCIGCGKQFSPKAADHNLCPKCAEDREKVLNAVLKQKLGAVFTQYQKDGDSAILEGFRKVKRLGTGGMSKVWLVQEEETGRKFALKTMLPQVTADERAKKTFLREARLVETLEHKNVIRVYKTGCESGMFFILMELCEGGSVDKYMERCGGKLPFDVATYIILQALDGLEYAHHADVSVECENEIRCATGIVHRDFKPGNIFLMDNGKYPVAKVADFGFAKAFETAGLSRHTRTGTVAATPVFQPRQQIANYKYSKPEVDVWAAAASYYNMLTGSFPKDVRGKDIWMEMYTGTPVPIRQRDSKIPEKLATVIDHALVESPEIGVKTAAEFKSRIIKALPMNIRHAVRGVL
ncbi:MAG TPA: hypothetical protein DDZ89_14795 [Clostridiales bacterium]|nr:hypothetical protein [Clostridiales bacterium]